MPFSPLRPTAISPTPALWPALLLVGVLGLQGCSMLRPGVDENEGDSASGTGPVIAESSSPSFAVEVRAPDAVRGTLERHLELQRFRNLPDVNASELQRLLGAADANARELLGTMGYFAPTITVELTETPAPRLRRAPWWSLCSPAHRPALPAQTSTSPPTPQQTPKT